MQNQEIKGDSISIHSMTPFLSPWLSSVTDCRSRAKIAQDLESNALSWTKHQGSFMRGGISRKPIEHCAWTPLTSNFTSYVDGLRDRHCVDLLSVQNMSQHLLCPVHSVRQERPSSPCLQRYILTTCRTRNPEQPLPQQDETPLHVHYQHRCRLGPCYDILQSRPQLWRASYSPYSMGNYRYVVSWIRCSCGPTILDVQDRINKEAPRV